jgi:tyrosyl-tRNA synthetase
MDIETKLDAFRCFAEEIVTIEELKGLLETNNHPLAYDGFEPSGLAPIHFGLLRAKNLKRVLSAGIRFNLYLADYFAFLNNKLGGDLEHIRTAGEYFVEIWKACGVDMSKVNVVWASELMDTINYWDRFMKVGKATTIERIKRAVTIMGRKEGENLSAGMLFYPAMQVTDIFQMDIDICQLGMDQRRANILAREIADKYKWKKPVAIHHPLMLGLQGTAAGKDTKKDYEAMAEFKMSKSNPKSAVYMHNTYKEIKEKIGSAYCPERVVEGNPMFNFIKLIIIDSPEDHITIERPEKFGGNIEAAGYGELERLYTAGNIHPLDIKNFVADKLEQQIRPVREHFEKDKRARELYEAVQKYQITR